MKIKIFTLLLGGKHPQALIELHDVVFVLAKNKSEAFQRARTKWFGDLKTAHVDAWLDLSTVDGHELCDAEAGVPGKTLYFINVGYYVDGVFNEGHRFFFLIGSNLVEVKKRAQKILGAGFTLPHTDNAENIEMIIALERVELRKLYWKPSLKKSMPQPRVGYWPLSPIAV